MKISFHGAARTVTGSKHLVTLANGKNLLLDCGLFQGLGAETENLNRTFGFDPTVIEVVLLSHAHIDHTGLLPKLVKEGFTGKIYCTPATKELAEILLYDSAEIQTYESEHKKQSDSMVEPYQPLYTPDDVTVCMSRFETVAYDTPVKAMEGVEAVFTGTGHLIGSAAISLRIKEGRKKTTLLFSGDIGRWRSVLLKPPVPPPPADYVIMESTYGDKHHDISFNTIETLHQWIQKICVQKGGQLIIPAFSVGRTQEVLYALNQLSLEKRLPELFYFIDSPLSGKATQTIKKYTNEFNDRLQQVLTVDDDPFDFPGLKYVERVEDSRKLVDYKEPCVIISASGTADAGRVRHHIKSCISNKSSAVLLVGYCGTKSLGGQLLSGVKEVEFFNEPHTVHAEIGQVQGMSAHGDMDDLIQFLGNQDDQKLKGIFLVHGEHAVQKAFCDRLHQKGFNRVECPAPHQEYELPLQVVRKRKRIPVAASTPVPVPAKQDLPAPPAAVLVQ